MAFTSGFDHDIFISYAHLDNPKFEGKQGWVDYFHTALEPLIAQRFGAINKVKIWRDPSLHGNTKFDERLKQTINNSAIFLSLLSPNYLISEYCKQELNWFHERAKDSSFGISVKGESRIFNIRLKNINHEVWPKPLQGTTGFELFRPGLADNDEGVTFDWEESAFRSELCKIVEAIFTTLDAFNKEIEKSVVQQPSVEPLKIFIADVNEDQKEIRIQLLRDLDSPTVQIMDLVPPPKEKIPHDTEVKNNISNADLSIHFLDKEPGNPVVDLATTTYPQRQIQIGLKMETPQLIWIPKNLDLKTIRDDQYNKFIQTIETHSYEGLNYEFIREHATEISKIVWQKIRMIQRKKALDERAHKILLDNHQKDSSCAFQLANHLSQAGLEIIFNQESIDPMASLENFEKALEHVQNLIIIFGNVTSQWILARLKKALKFVTNQMIELNQTNLVNRWLYLMPPSQITNEITEFAEQFKFVLLHNRHIPQIDPLVVQKIVEECEGRGC